MIDILGDLLGGAPPALPAVVLRYDYAQIAAEHRDAVQDAAVAITRSGRRAQESMLEIGRRLAEVKELLPFGQFSDWCEVEFSLSQRTAQRMMAVAETFGERGEAVSLLSDSALYLLSGPSVPEEAREAVIAEAQEKGGSPTKARVQAVIAEHKEPRPPKNTNTLGDDLTDELLRRYWAGHQSTCGVNDPHLVDELRAHLTQSKRGFLDKTWYVQVASGGKVEAQHCSNGPTGPGRAPDAVFTVGRFAELLADWLRRNRQPPPVTVTGPIAEHKQAAPAAPAAPREARLLSANAAQYELTQAMGHMEGARSLLVGERDDVVNGLDDVLAQVRRLIRMLDGHAQ